MIYPQKSWDLRLDFFALYRMFLGPAISEMVLLFARVVGAVGPD